MNDFFERNHPMKDDKEFITSYWTDRAKDFGALRAKELESPKLKLWIDEVIYLILKNLYVYWISDVEPVFSASSYLN